MMFLIKFTSFLACIGILAFSGYKTVESIRINDMIDEISAVIETTSLIPPMELPDSGDHETPDGDGKDDPSSDGDGIGGEQGGNNSDPTPTPTPDPLPSIGDSLTTEEAVDAFGGLYDNHDPDFNEINKEFFVGMVEGVLNGSDSAEPPASDAPDFDNSFDTDFDDNVDLDKPFVPDDDPTDDDTDEIKNIVLDVAGNYYENLQQGIQNNIDSNRDASEEDQQVARDEFIKQEAEAFAGLLNIATKPEEVTDEQIVQSVDAVLQSTVCLETVTQTVSNNDSLVEMVQDATEGMNANQKVEIKNKLNEALAENPEMEEHYNTLAELFGITLGGK